MLIEGDSYFVEIFFDADQEGVKTLPRIESTVL